MDQRASLLRSHVAGVQMKDNTPREIDFERRYTTRGYLFHEGVFISTSFIVFVLTATLVGLTVTTAGIWALVQCVTFFPMITTQASISVIIISALFIIVGVLMIAGIVGCVLFVKCERASIFLPERDGCSVVTALIFISIFGLMLTSLGIAAGSLITSLSGNIETSANNSLFTILDSQGARDAWDTAQNKLKCCGVLNFSDYGQVFNNFSVPVSCCNTTNPLVNETTCPDIVKNTDVANITELIYTEGCVPQFVSFFHLILSVVAGVGIIIGGIPIIGGMYSSSLLISINSCYRRLINKNVEKTHKYFPMVVGIILLLGVSFISIAVWALVQDLSFYYFITAPDNKNLIVLLSLLTIAGLLMIGTSICQIAAGITAIKSPKQYFFCPESSCVCLCILPMLILPLVVGIVAAVMNGPTSMELSNTLNKYLDDHAAHEAWNNLQENKKCCGVTSFADYETVFNNFSVPVSCCNTTNPLASECPDIVRNSQQMINETGLIYTEGCVSQLDSFFRNIFAIIFIVCTTIAGLQLAAVIIGLWCYNLAACII